MVLGHTLLDEVTERLLLWNCLQQLLVVAEMEVKDVSRLRGVTAVQKIGLHLGCEAFAVLAAQTKSKGGKKFLFLKQIHELIPAVREFCRTRLAVNGTLYAGAAGVGHLALLVFVVLDLLCSPLEPGLLDTLVIDFLGIKDCVELVAHKDLVLKRNNSLPSLDEMHRNLLEFTEPRCKLFRVVQSCGEQDHLHG